jgi:glycosyltransferase involved in cell wall biosynthesis
MSEIQYPKVLIVGQPFNTSSGGGITLSNLFRGWPGDKIAVAAYGLSTSDVSADICSTYYQLGDEEFRWIFPFRFFMQHYQSGEFKIRKDTGINATGSKKKFYLTIIRKLLTRFVRWSGLIFCASETKISDRMAEWLSVLQPEVLYLQVSTREGILFANALCDHLNIPVALHMMDDWPSTISNRGILKRFWNRKIDAEFRHLLESVDLPLSISCAMSREYRMRYGIEFIPFHNPIDTNLWLKHSKSEMNIDENHVSLLYAGRIGAGIHESLLEVAGVIEKMRKKGKNIFLCIQTPVTDLNILSALSEFDGVIINKPAEYSRMPELFSSADVLLLANDFSKKAMDFLKFSMPTKVSEYLISGTPVLLYAPKENAVSVFFRENQCGLCVSENYNGELLNAIEHLITDTGFRKKLNMNGIKVATEKFDCKHVRATFRQLLINIAVIGIKKNKDRELKN